MATENNKKLSALRKRLEKKYKDDVELFPDFTTIKQIDVIPSPSAIINTISGIGGFPRGRLSEIHGPYSSGKGLPLDETVLAKKAGDLSGYFKFLPMGELETGDLVKCPDGTNSTILATFPAERPVYEITWEDGRTSRCDDQHLWPVRINGRTPEEWPFELCYANDLVDLSTKYKDIRVPLVDGKVDTGRRKDLDPYSVGLMLGDGSFKSEARFFTTDRELAEHMEKEGFAKSNFESEDSKCPSWRLTKKHNPKAWDKWRLSGLKGKVGVEKEIPEPYRNSTYSDRLSLLQGLMDTDGTIDADGTSVSFCNKSLKLVEQTKELVFSLGGKARVRPKVVNDQVYYNLDIWMLEPCFRLQRKLNRWVKGKRNRHNLRMSSIRKVKDLASTKCIKISHPSGLFIMRDFVVTHNTTICTEVIAAAQQNDPEAVAMFLDFEHAWDARYARKLGTDLSPDRLIFMQPTYFEQGADAALLALEEGLIDILVIDSAAAMTPRSELEGDMDTDGGTQKGTQSALMARFLAKATKLLSRGRKPAMVLINQTRANIQIGGRPQKNAPKEQAAGGNAIKFYTSLRFSLEITANEGETGRGSKAVDQTYTQNRVRVTCVKNKLAPPFMRGQIVIEYGKGINNLVSLGELAEAKLGIMSGAGFFKYEGDTAETSFTCRGRDAFQELLEERPALQREIEKKVVNAIRAEHAELLGLDDIKVQGRAKEVEEIIGNGKSVFLDTEEEDGNSGQTTNYLNEGGGLPLED